MAYRNMTISMGLVSVSVTMDPLCDKSSRPGGKRVCPDDFTPLKQQNVCPTCGGIHSNSEAVTVYERSGELVKVDAPDKPDPSPAISLDKFVDSFELAEIESSYQLAPDMAGAEGYSILHASLRKTGTYAIGTVQMDKATRQIAIEATERGLRMHKLRYADVFRPEGDYLVPVKPAMVNLGVQLIESLRGEHERIRDEYTAELTEAINMGKVVGLISKPKKDTDVAVSTNVVDLQSALKASVAANKTSKSKPKSKTKVS